MAKKTKPECDACGSTKYDGELKECPFCGGTKCTQCDMGNGVECPACYNDEDDE